MISTSGSLKIMRRKLKRTPEAIASSAKALEIGYAMLREIEPKAHTFRLCEDGLQTLKRWIDGTATVAECRASALRIHESAKSCDDLRQRDALRAIAHAIATAHVSSHLEACEKYSVKVLRHE